MYTLEDWIMTPPKASMELTSHHTGLSSLNSTEIEKKQRNDHVKCVYNVQFVI